MMRSRPALHADQAGGLLTNAPQLHPCDIHAVCLVRAVSE
jgi:hypothetical protein